MPAIDVVLIGREQNGLAIARKRNVLGFEFAVDVQRRGRIAVDRDGVEVHVAGLLPGEDDAIARAPEQLVFGDHGVEGAAGAFGGMPELAAISGIDGCQTDGPRLGGAARPEEDGAHSGRLADESDLLSILRPDRVGVAIDTGIEIGQGFGAEVVDADEGVFSSGR